MTGVFENKDCLVSPKISIIVPIYNVEKYLRRCLDSIRAQTFTDFECICIDDGSPDGSGRILDEYAELDGRFRVIHQENAGVSAARNVGLDAARGEWIAFCDSDDWIEADYMKTMYETVAEIGADLVVCGINLELKNGKKQFLCCVKAKEVYDSKEKFLNKFASLRGKSQYDACIHSVVNKFYSINLLNAVRFSPDIKYSEDYLFNLDIFENVEKCVFVEKAFYTYSYNPLSATHKIEFLKEAEDNYLVIRKTYDFFEKHKLSKASSSIFARTCFCRCVVEVSRYCAQLQQRLTATEISLFKNLRKYFCAKYIFIQFYLVKRTFVLFLFAIGAYRTIVAFSKLKNCVIRMKYNWIKAI